MPDDKFPKAINTEAKEKSLEEFTQQELERRLRVGLSPDLSPGDLVAYLNEYGNCKIIIDTDFFIYVGITPHLSMLTNLGHPTILVGDGYVEKRRSPYYEFFYEGSWSMSSVNLKSRTNTENLKKAIGKKVMEYLRSIGVQTK